MFALIIGIDIYKSNDVADLYGGVSDARAIESYLTDGLGVDKSRIRMLLNEEATRQGIINALVALRDNDDIEHGEAILIYYCGHGRETSVLNKWATDGTEKRIMIQTIIPQEVDKRARRLLIKPLFGLSRTSCGNGVTTLYVQENISSRIFLVTSFP